MLTPRDKNTKHSEKIRTDPRSDCTSNDPPFLEVRAAQEGGLCSSRISGCRKHRSTRSSGSRTGGGTLQLANMRLLKTSEHPQLRQPHANSLLRVGGEQNDAWQLIARFPRAQPVTAGGFQQITEVVTPRFTSCAYSKAESAKIAVLLGSAFWFGITCEVYDICAKPGYAYEP